MTRAVLDRVIKSLPEQMPAVFVDTKVHLLDADWIASSEELAFETQREREHAVEHVADLTAAHLLVQEDDHLQL